MAHLSQDTSLVDAFNNGDDIHSRTAADVYNVSINDVQPSMRRTAKIVNFGLLYGAGPFRMSQELGIPQKEAKALIEKYFDTYSGIKKYVEDTMQKAKKNRFVKTLLGRKRPVWDIDSSNHLHREAAKRMAINMPIQGTSAEMIKIAMTSVSNHLNEHKMKSKLVLQIHDELVFETPKNELNDFLNSYDNTNELTSYELYVDYTKKNKKNKGLTINKSYFNLFMEEHFK